MLIRADYEIAYECPRPTPMVLMLSLHPSRLDDLAGPAVMVLDPPMPVQHYRDLYGNVCSRIAAPAGPVTISSDFVINDSGLPDEVAPEAEQIPVEKLPDDVLVYLLGSRYCDTDHLSNLTLVAVQRRADGMGARAGDLRLRQQPPHFRLPARFCHTDGLGGIPRAARGVPRFCAPCDHPVPVHEHPRGATAPAIWAISACRRCRSQWTSAPGSKPTSAGAGTPSMRATTCPASAAS